MEARLYTIITLLLISIQGLDSISVSKAETRDRAHQSQQQQYSPFSYSANHGSLVSVQTSSGLLNGAKHSLTIPGHSIYKFLSVPYAEAPIGFLRFQRPVEIKQDRSSMIVDSTKFGKTCPQYRHLTRFISPLLNVDNEHQTSEDCLHVNVFVPATVGTIDNDYRLEPSKQLPVIVWIPGEGFDFADARQFDASFLAHKTQSIVVTVQYRVGVLGFLQAPKLNITGNMGIHDQIMALKWVKRNIGAFGGDSERVTLMGRFSGSMSISAMITAPNQELIKLNGRLLFNRVAMLSGVAVDDWIIDSRQFEKVKQLEELAMEKEFCTLEQVRNETCLQTLPVDELLRISDYGWRLVIDNELIGQVSPIEATKQNQLASELEAILIGETAMEGSLCLYRHMLEDHSTNYAQLIEEDKLATNDLYDIIRYDSQSYFRYNLTEMNPIQTALESIVEDSSRFGATEQESSLRLRDKYLNACSSYMIKSHLHQFKRNIMARNRLGDNRMDSNKRSVEVFHYELKYKPTFSLAPDYIKTAAHGDDVPLIFGLIYNQPRKDVNEADLLITRKMMAYIGNFVHGNNPLLRQHLTIGSLSKSNENTTSMDESEISSQDGPAFAPLVTRRSWSNEGQIDAIELNEIELNEMNNSSPTPNRIRQSPSAGTENISAIVEQSNNKEISITRSQNPIKIERQNIRVIVVESPVQSLSNVPPTDYLVQSIIDTMEQQRAQQIDDSNQQFDPLLTRSQRLMELHRQQNILENNLWIQNSRKGSISVQPTPSTQQQTPTMTLVNESSFMTMLVFSSCIVILTLMSICLGLCLMIFRHNTLASKKKIQRFIANSSSSCNICDDSQGSSMDAVLAGGQRCKDGQGFGNVFAKLRNHNGLINTPQHQPQCTSTSVALTRPQTISNHPGTDMVLHQQRVENHANNQEH